jgi:hypothetical protein
MTDRKTGDQSAQSNMEKDPDYWTMGQEPMTAAQRSYLKTLSEEGQGFFRWHADQGGSIQADR